MFGIDPRTLALFRVAIALVLLYDLVGRVVDVRAFYSDEGIVTVAQQQEMLLPWLWSLNFLNGSVGFQTAIFVIAFILATALLVGVLIGTYSSIFVANPSVLALGISREDMLPVKKEGAETDALP